MNEHLPILKRVGKILIIVGLVDIGVMIYCIANGISYSSSFNIFSVVAGVFLLRGSLRAATIVTWLAAIFVVMLVGLPFVYPFVQPLELTWLQLHLYPATFAIAVVMWAFVVGLLYWVIRELRRKPVLIAREQSGKKAGSLRVPLALGGLVLIVFAIAVPMGLKSETGHLAQTKAMEQLGPGYKYVVSTLHISESQQGRLVSAMVTAYNDKEIRMVSVKWSEK
ncbi:MAG: hypothetical protein P4L77_03450 [Sulfuriferula sp.]|nr:hypothetical protein [Sulfuriferula sp.]